MKVLNLSSVATNYPDLNKIKHLVNKNLPAKTGNYELATMREMMDNDYLLDLIRKHYKMKLGVRNTETEEIIIELDDDYLRVSNGFKLKAEILETKPNLFEVVIYIEREPNTEYKEFTLMPNNVLVVNDYSFIYNLLKNRFMKTTDYEQNLQLYKIDVINDTKRRTYDIPTLSNVLVSSTTVNCSFENEINIQLLTFKSLTDISDVTFGHNEVSFDLSGIDITTTITNENDELYNLNLRAQDFLHLDTNKKSFRRLTDLFDFLYQFIIMYEKYKLMEKEIVKLLT